MLVNSIKISSKIFSIMKKSYIFAQICGSGFQYSNLKFYFLLDLKTFGNSTDIIFKLLYRISSYYITDKLES